MEHLDVKVHSKSTEELYHELLAARRIGDYLQDNAAELNLPELHLYLQALLREKKLTRAEVIRRANLETSYGYRLFEGSKNKPGRDKVLALALGFHLTVPECDKLLQYAGLQQLYPRNQRDSILSFALQKGQDLAAVNQLLADFGCAELDLLRENK